MTVSLEAIRPKKFNLLDPTKTITAVRANMRQYLEEVAQKLSQYPSEAKKRSRYVRTGRLGRGWTAGDSIQISGNGASGTLTNRVPYAGIVQGPTKSGISASRRDNEDGDSLTQQQRMRRIGWKSITDVTRETRPRYYQLMNKAVRSSIE